MSVCPLREPHCVVLQLHLIEFTIQVLDVSIPVELFIYDDTQKHSLHWMHFLMAKWLNSLRRALHINS